MSKELVVQLIQLKKRIHQENHDLVIAELDAEGELACCPPADKEYLEKKRHEAVANNLAAQAKLKRAYLFSPRYTHGLVPTLCIACYVDRHIESLMAEVPVGIDCWDGKKQYECPACKHVLRVDPTLNLPA